MPIDVLCIGHAAYDLSFFVDGYPQENSKCETGESLEDCGGPAANAAYLMSLWGMSSGFAGLVGDDVFGHRIRDQFTSVGTDISLLELRPGHVTPLSMVTINKANGTRTIVNRKREGPALQMVPSLLAAMKPHVLLFDGHELDVSLVALAAFPEAVSILDAGSWREGTAALASRVSYLAASERFALQATGLSNLDEEAAQRECVAKLRAQFNTTTIVTLGERGLVFDDGAGFAPMPAFPADAVDTTAAGDIFHGALAFAIASNMDLRTALRFASMAASLSVRQRGGRSSIPAQAEVKRALALC